MLNIKKKKMEKNKIITPEIEKTILLNLRNILRSE